MKLALAMLVRRWHKQGVNRALPAKVRNEAMTNQTPIRYEVTNRKTGQTTSYKTSAAASRAVVRMDNAYGAYICTRRAIWSDAV